MHIVVVITFLLINIVSIAEAQQTWPVVPNCMSDLSYPIIRRGNWDFPGVILSSIYPEGVHGIRADQDIEYFVALESDHSFPAAGSISPDGLYFAYPIGATDYHVNIVGDDVLGVDFIRVVRTDGNTDETYQLEARNFAYSGIARSFNLPTPIWLENEWLYYSDLSVSSNEMHNFKTGNTREWISGVEGDSLWSVAPDGTRAFVIERDAPDTLYDLGNDVRLDYTTNRQIAWFADSSAFIEFDETGISIVDRDGHLLETIDFQGVTDVGLAPNNAAFAFWGQQQNLYIADVTHKVIYDLCFQGKLSPWSWNPANFFSNLAWSPDSRALAFSYDDYLVILDTHTFENQVIDHRSFQVIGWMPLQDEIYSSSDEGIRPPPSTEDA